MTPFGLCWLTLMLAIVIFIMVALYDEQLELLSHENSRRSTRDPSGDGVVHVGDDSGNGDIRAISEDTSL